LKEKGERGRKENRFLKGQGGNDGTDTSKSTKFAPFPRGKSAKGLRQKKKIDESKKQKRAYSKAHIVLDRSITRTSKVAEGGGTDQETRTSVQGEGNEKKGDELFYDKANLARNFKSQNHKLRGNQKEKLSPNQKKPAPGRVQKERTKRCAGSAKKIT